jgi:two-component system LytT family sensor kinase
MMDSIAAAGALDSRQDPARVAPIAWLIAIYWIAQFVILTTMRMIWSEGMESPLFLLPRTFMALVGVGLSFAIHALHRRFVHWSWARRLALAFLAAMIAAQIHALINFLAFQVVMPKENMASSTAMTIVSATLQWVWTYAAISALLLTASYSDELLERERRMADLQELAHSAQLRSLRYQLNPHFMFNTLNSVAALIAGERADQAEQMVETLADFLRASLALDPNDDLTLEKELELQSLYLSIESARFSDRLTVETRLAADVRDALVPSLILQPIVENAIKHGVARNPSPSTIRIEADRRGDRLEIEVSNAVPEKGARALGGTRVGLANVARRIALRYGDEGKLEAGLEGERFVVRLVVPVCRG